MEHSASLNYEIRAWSFALSCAGDGRLDRRRLELKLTLLNEMFDFALSSKESPHKLPTTIGLIPGDPITGGGERIEGGCGYLIYHPSLETGEDNFPACISGWAALPPPDFDRLWSLLSQPAGFTPRLAIKAGPVNFVMPDGSEWDVERQGHLVINELQCTLSSAGWFDEGG